jgi:hypothetical protein
MIPAKFRIARDNYHARHVGVTRDGRQFFLTTPFVPAVQGRGQSFVATYLFDREGSLVEDRIEKLDARPDDRVPPGNIDMRVAQAALDAHLAALDVAEFCSIEIAPFEIERFGIGFGLIPLPDEYDPDHDVIEIHPGNYMAFYAPWDGDYDT